MGDKGDKKIHLDFRFDFAGSHPVDFTDNEAKRMRKRKLIFMNKKDIIIATLKNKSELLKYDQLLVIIVLLCFFLLNLFSLAWRCLFVLASQRSNSTATSFLTNTPGSIIS